MKYGLHKQSWVLFHHVLAPFLGPLAWLTQRLFSNEPGSPGWPDITHACFHHAGDGFDHRLAVALSSVFVWLAAISALPHKEERFLYVVYPLVSFLKLRRLLQQGTRIHNRQRGARTAFQLLPGEA